MSNLPVDHRIEGEWRMKIKVYLEESEDGAIPPSFLLCLDAFRREIQEKRPLKY